MNSRLSLIRVVALPFAGVLLSLAVACGGSDEQGPSPEPFPSDTAAATTAPAAVTFPPVPTFAGCPAPSGAPPEVQAKSYPQRPAMSIDPSRQYLAHVYTTRGHFIIELLPGVAPEHVNSFVFLAREKFYNGTTFHRVIPDFVAQGGDPTGLGNGGPGYTVPLEPSDEPFVRGVVGMARSQDPDSAGSQFFITYAPAPNLDGGYTVFGKVVQGMEFVDCLTPRDPSTDPNAPPGDAIIDIAIQEI
jgi:cyclophilin family peptidyl-prolyl cis-trans isomerase